MPSRLVRDIFNRFHVTSASWCHSPHRTPSPQLGRIVIAIRHAAFHSSPDSAVRPSLDEKPVVPNADGCRVVAAGRRRISPIHNEAELHCRNSRSRTDDASAKARANVAGAQSVYRTFADCLTELLTNEINRSNSSSIDRWPKIPAACTWEGVHRVFSWHRCTS
jgi:hypothetical protein